MVVIPVIDIREGRSVRTVEGLEDKTIYYNDTPIMMARLFRKENAKVIHITDLDGAYSGKMRNYDLIKEITETVDVPIELGGGIRSYEIARQLLVELGVYRIVIGTLAVEDKKAVKELVREFSPRKIIVSIDVRNGFIVKHGWKEQAGITGTEHAMDMKELGIERIIYQDVSRVGTLSGPDTEGTKDIAVKTGLRVTAAGGIGSYQDLKKIQELEPYGVDSVMMSRALYENKFPCQAVWREYERADTSLDLPKVK